ncbi:hypothetical protein AYO38_09875 [bacterium SCGC AG-212-C10]|nr:hypothetical protein AYO38_09875 [bacterium SCGC AG-212-C10]
MKIRRTGERSGDLIDARGAKGGGATGGLPIPGGMKAGLPALLILIVGALLGGRAAIGGDGGSGGGLGDIFGQLGAAPTGNQTNLNDAPDPDADLVDFMDFIIGDVNDSWAAIFQSGGQTYTRAKLELFDGGVQTGCGAASSAVGPFYCPPDQKAYLDLSFFRELAAKYKAPGDFAQAYVIAHEIGHHVQNLTGVNEEVNRLSKKTPSKANEYSVRQELQADCLAGVWAHTAFTRDLLEDGDIEEGLAAAAAVGDDRLQKQATGRVNPESFTHGTSAQRMKWFQAGYDSGDADSCDTFSGGI